MHIVPVIDLKGGVVVHARRGDRQRYAPLQSRLASSAAPLEVVEGIMRLHPFSSLYVADLDAIACEGNNDAALAEIAAAFPDLEVWVDAGVSGLDAAADILAHHNRHVIVGSESQTSDELLLELAANPHAVLSLDFFDDRFLGYPEILHETSLWPRRILVLTLSRVGAAQGPDLDRIAEVSARSEGRAVYAAGGVRHVDDLLAVRAAGGAGALIATALHDGSIGPIQLTDLAS